MVDKKDIKSVNKSDEIRKLAAAMKERGEKPRPVVIVATLKKQGVVVSSPQVSMVLKGMGFRPRKRLHRPPECSPGPAHKPGYRPLSAGSSAAYRRAGFWRSP